MTGKKRTDLGELRMKAGDFDSVMRKALQVKPDDGKPKKAAKAKAKKPK